MSSLYVIVGGGIAAVTCARELRDADKNCRITLIAASPLLKVVRNQTLVGQLLQSFDVSEETANNTFTKEDEIEVIQGKVTDWIPQLKYVALETGQRFYYDKLCICTGARPKSSCQHPLAISIRDTETIECLNTKLRKARRVVVVGNGGIATEVVYELKNVEIIWAIRHSSISATFFDEGAAEFFKPMLLYEHAPDSKQMPCVSKKYKICVGDSEKSESEVIGCALGPDWASSFDIKGCLEKRSVHVIYNVEMSRILKDDEKVANHAQSPYSRGDWPLYLELNDGQLIGTDLLIQATGVQPNSDFWSRSCKELMLANDGGILVDDHMVSSVPDVYACGDVCTAGWKWAKHWMQMRLWTQAYQMGAYCGRAMAMPDISLDFCFEMFTHVTTFFGYKVIFLGRFNAFGLGKPWHALMRITKDRDYIKLLVHNGRIQGAVLVGNTNLEETIENLILNQIDITDVEDGLLDPNIEIADYFD